MTFENIDTLAKIVIFFMASCVFLTMTYIIYSFIKWYAKHREMKARKNTLIQIWGNMTEFEKHLWNNIGELN